jgi:hypothetical protein
VDAVARLQSAFASEEFSVLTGEHLLVIDLDAPAAAIDAADLARARARLGELACPSVGLSRRGSASPLADVVDVRVESDAQLRELAAAVHGSPLASLALVQLLRLGASLGIHDGLIAESLVYSVLQSGPEFRAWLDSRKAGRPRRQNPAPAVLTERTGDRLELTLNRPEKHNAFSAEMRDGLVEALHVAVSDASLAEIVLRGAGPSFCSGGDLDEFGTLPDPASAHGIRSTRSPARLMAACGERLTVELHGACVGAGIELPAFAGRVIAAPDTFVQLPEVAFGLVPGAGGTVSIPRRIGRQRAAWLALTSARLPVEQALAWGLVDEIAG